MIYHHETIHLEWEGVSAGCVKAQAVGEYKIINGVRFSAISPRLFYAHVKEERFTTQLGRYETMKEAKARCQKHWDARYQFWLNE